MVVRQVVYERCQITTGHGAVISRMQSKKVISVSGEGVLGGKHEVFLLTQNTKPSYRTGEVKVQGSRV